MPPRRLVDVRPGEGRTLALSFLAFFSLLTAYYILRPIREERAVAVGAAKLPYLYAWVFGTMLALVAGVVGTLDQQPLRRRRITNLVGKLADNVFHDATGASVIA